MIKDINNIDPKLLEEDDRIDSYLKGQMTEEEEQKFLKELEDNPELKEKAIVTARLLKGLKEVGAEQDKTIMQAFLASSEEGIKAVAKRTTQVEETANLSGNAAVNSGTVSIRKVSTWFSIAASLIFVVWLGFGYNDYRKTTALADEYASEFGTSMIARGRDGESVVEQKLTRLFDNVNTKNDLDNTLHELSLCWELSTMETYNDYTEYAAEIGWNLAIGYLKDNNKKDALIVLAKMSTLYDADTVVGKQVRELQQKIEDL